MKKALSIGCLVLAGCGASDIPLELFQACPNTAAADIRGALIIIERFVDEGASKGELIDGAFDACQSDTAGLPTSELCFLCTSTMVDVAFDRAGQTPSTPTQPIPPADGLGCSNTCRFAFDGECDDGGPGSSFTDCDFGTDCADCGPRDDSPSLSPNDSCPNDPNKTAPGLCGCGIPDSEGCGELLVAPLDAVIVLADLSVWTVSTDDVFLATSWLAGDNLAFVDGAFLDSFLNTRTGETAGVRFQEIGTQLTIASFQEREFRSRLVSFDDGTTWGIFFDDENESRTWRVGEDVVIYDNGFFHEIVNLRTGRVIALDSTP